MIYGLYHSAAGMLTTEYRQSVTANNLANADTVGFKRDIVTLAERQPASVAGLRSGASDPGMQALSGGLWLGRTYTDYSAASKTPTGNPLDVALDGRGFLAVAGPGGQTLYTRDGRMTTDRVGRLVAVSDGAPILGRGGGPLQLDPNGGAASINESGRITQDGRVVGELELVDFKDYAALQKVGASRVAAPANSAVPAAPLVESGYTEASGVQPISELVNMMDAARAYQMNAQMISMQDQTIGRLIGVISR
jgi:flagellar basal-body rod protein FlgF